MGRVTEIMSEISSASHEQSAGIEQANQAINQMAMSRSRTRP
ncbi:hypothetical protein [Paraburkholderia guartelaensis]